MFKRILNRSSIIFIFLVVSINIINSVQSLSCVQLFVTPRTAAIQAFLAISNSQSLLELMSIKSGMPSNHLIPGRPLLLLPLIFPNIRVFASESVLCIRRPKYWSFSFSISPSNEYSGLINIRTVVVYFIVDYLFDPLEVKLYEGSHLFVLSNNSGCITLAGILRKYLLN